MSLPTFALALHADWRCGRSGACCTAGWPIPVAQLPTWIKGLPGNADYQLATDGRLESLRDQQWQIHYQGYARNRLWLLPTQLTLQGPQTTIKLVIHEWQIEQ